MKNSILAFSFLFFLTFLNKVQAQVFVLTDQKGDYNWEYMFEAMYDAEANSILAYIGIVPEEGSPCSEYYEFELVKDAKGQFVVFMGEPGDYKNAIVADAINPETELPNAMKVFSTSTTTCLPKGTYKYEIIGD